MRYIFHIIFTEIVGFSSKWKLPKTYRPLDKIKHQTSYIEKRWTVPARVELNKKKKLKNSETKLTS